MGMERQCIRKRSRIENIYVTHVIYMTNAILSRGMMITHIYVKRKKHINFKSFDKFRQIILFDK